MARGKHTKGKRPSTKQKHQRGRTRKARDRRGERGDAKRRFPRKRPRNHEGSWPPNGFRTMRQLENADAFLTARQALKLAYRYLNGDGVKRDYAHSSKYCCAAAQMGDAEAQFLLGTLFEHGLGVSKDFKKAFFWYKAAAESRLCRWRIMALGVCYTPKGWAHFKKGKSAAAYEWFRKSARTDGGVIGEFTLSGTPFSAGT